MLIAIASDHAGFELKQAILLLFKELKINWIDLGSDNSDSVDYPDYAAAVASKVSKGEAQAGILVCGTGIGMAMVANKFKGVRAAVVHDEVTARLTKQHNNSNVLALGGRFMTAEQARAIIQAWLTSNYEGGRHDRRLQKILEIEKENFKS